MATKKTTLTVIDAMGAKHTRTTARTYTHVVMVRQPLAGLLADAQRYLETAIRWGDRPDAVARGQMDVARREAEIEASTDGLTPWGDLCWCGRADLAAKEVAKYSRNPNLPGWVFDIVEVPAQ